VKKTTTKLSGKAIILQSCAPESQNAHTFSAKLYFFRQTLLVISAILAQTLRLRY
jgi:hypothetical protein